MSQKNYKWIGFSTTGKKITGSLEAPNISSAKQKLHDNNILLWKIKTTSQISLRKNKIKSQTIYSFPHELHILIKAGIPLANACAILEKTTTESSYVKLLAQIRSSLEQGNMLSTTLKQHKKYFDNLFITLVYIGEQSGTLENMLNHITIAQQKLTYQKRQIKKALFYPATILCIAILVTTTLLIFVVPSFQTLWQSFGAQLPLYTRLVIMAAHWLRLYTGYIIVTLGIQFMLWRIIYKHSPKLQLNLQKWLTTKAPLLSKILRQIFAAKFLRILAITIQAGVPLLESLHLSNQIFRSRFYKKKLLTIQQQISSGTMLSSALSKSDLVPQRVTSMLSVAEQAGNLDQILDETANHYDDTLQNLISNMNMLLEPAIMILLGIIIGAIIIAMYLPIFQLGKIL